MVLEIGRGVPPIESLRLRKLSLEARSQTLTSWSSAADLWAAAAAADPSWDGMSGARESRGRLC